MARIQTWEELGSGGPRPARAPVGGDFGGQEIAGGIKKVGAALTDIGDDVVRQQNYDDVLKADDNHLQKRIEITRSFDNDPDYTTFAPRAKAGLDAVTTESASMIRDPQMRQRWMKRAQGENYTSIDQVTRLGDTLAREDAQSKLKDTLDTYSSQYSDPSLDDEGRANILRNMDARIGAGEQAGTIRPLVGRKIREQYIGGVLSKDAERRMYDPNEVDQVLKDLQGAGTGPQSSNEPADFRDQGGPASIRYNNPGAMWPGPSAKKFGAIDAVNLADGQGNKIAVFPDAISGAAAQFDLLSSKYVGKTLASAVRQWSGSNSVPTYLKVIQEQTGISPDTKLTPDVLANPDVAIPLAKAMATQEAGRPYPLSDAQWKSAFNKANGLADDNTQVADASGSTALTTSDASAPTSNRYALLPAQTRAHLITRAKIAQSQIAQTAVKGDIDRLENGLQPQTDDQGRTAIDRYKGILQPNVWNKLNDQLETAKLAGQAITPLSDISTVPEDDGSSPLEKHFSELLPSEDMDNASYHRHDVVANTALKAWQKIKKTREDDPAGSVSGFSDGKRSYPPSTEVRDAQEFIQNASPDVFLGSNGSDGVQANEDPQSSIKAQEHLIEARIAAQNRVGIRPWNQKIITKAEATDLLQLPSKWDDLSDEDLSTALTRAAQRSIETYGPQYGERAFDEAVRFAHANKDAKTQAMEIGAALASGRMNLDDLKKHMFAPKDEGGWLNWFSDEEPDTSEDDSDTKNQMTGALALKRQATQGANIPDFSPWTDVGQGERQPYIAQSKKMGEPNQDQINWLKSNPDKAKMFDSFFNQPGLSARVLSGQ